MYDTVLFDLDGTVTDPGIGITNSVIYALKRYGIEVSDRKELYKFIGPPLRESFEKYYGIRDGMNPVTIYREYYAEKGIFECQVYEGIPELLSALKKQGIRIILATSKPEKYASDILRHFGIDRYFDFVCGATMDEKRCEKQDIIGFAIEKAGITDISRAVMVGDREYDVLGAKYFGMDSIAVTYGYGTKDELDRSAPTFRAADAGEILGIIVRE